MCSAYHHSNLGYMQLAYLFNPCLHQLMAAPFEPAHQGRVKQKKLMGERVKYVKLALPLLVKAYCRILPLCAHLSEQCPSHCEVGCPIHSQSKPSVRVTTCRVALSRLVVSPHPCTGDIPLQLSNGLGCDCLEPVHQAVYLVLANPVCNTNAIQQRNGGMSAS